MTDAPNQRDPFLGPMLDDLPVIEHGDDFWSDLETLMVNHSKPVLELSTEAAVDRAKNQPQTALAEPERNGATVEVMARRYQQPVRRSAPRRRVAERRCKAVIRYRPTQSMSRQLSLTIQILHRTRSNPMTAICRQMSFWFRSVSPL